VQPKNIIRGCWCPKCSHGRGNRKYDLDHDFFSNDTEESFYVAGFLAADGWKIHRSLNSYVIGLSLAAKDVDHLKIIRDLMKCTSPIKFRERYRSQLPTGWSCR
jgi:hypothetical protein